MGLEGNLRLLYETIDIETSENIKIEYGIDDRLKGAINWLSQTYNTNQGFNPPNDEDRLKQMANAIAHYGLDYDNDALIHYCINNGILETPARKMAHYFEKAKRR